jgi:transcriptional regulator with XRE-family HTH domain
MSETTHLSNSNLGNFIRECRKGLKYTSRQVARLSGERKDLPSISNSYLISVENGKHIPRLDKVIALADVLNVPVTQLVERCREDLGSGHQPPELQDFHSLFEAGRERAEMSDHTAALQAFRQAYQVVAASNGAIAPGQVSELKLQIANCYRRLKINRVAKEELENLLRDRALDPRLRARTAFALSEIYREEQSVFLGSILAREALEMARTAGDEVLEGKLLSTLGSLAADEGKLDDALNFYREAACKLKKLGHERAARLARTRQGILLVEKREYFKAIDLLRTELNECRERDPYVLGWLHIGLAKAYYGAENYKSARIHARSGKECAEKLDAPDMSFTAVFFLWQVARMEEADNLAGTYFERLKHDRAKLDVSLEEVKLFDRLLKRIEKVGKSEKIEEKGAVR